MAGTSGELFLRCFRNWLTQQRQDLSELLHALNSDPDNAKNLQQLAEKNIKHYQEYYESRAQLSKQDATSFMCPSWCTSFENSFLWIGGCRPSLSFRLLYAVTGSELESRLNEYLQGTRSGDIIGIPAGQLRLVNDLHCKTIEKEDKLSSVMATLQEDIADDPLALIAKKSNQIGESSEVVDTVMNALALSLAGILADADRLRLSTLKELIGILSPLQAVDFLVATKKLHLSLHEWGKRRDNLLGKISCQM